VSVSSGTGSPGSPGQRAVKRLLFCCCHTITMVIYQSTGLLKFTYNIHSDLNKWPHNVLSGGQDHSITQTSLKVKVKGQGHQGQKRHFPDLSAACTRFMFPKTSGL